MDRNAAKRLGRSTQKWVPDVTWSPLPQRMLELLLKIAEREPGITHRPPSGRRASPSAMSECPGNRKSRRLCLHSVLTLKVAGRLAY